MAIKQIIAVTNTLYSKTVVPIPGHDDKGDDDAQHVTGSSKYPLESGYLTANE